MNEKPLTVGEAASFLSVNPWQVRYYVNSGQLKAYKMGNSSGRKGSRKHWRIFKQDLIDFLNRGSNAKE